MTEQTSAISAFAPGGIGLRRAWVVLLMLLFSVLVLVVDVAAEIYHAIVVPDDINATSIIHVAVESVATVFACIAIDFMRRLIRTLSQQTQADAVRIRGLRGDFDYLLDQRFAEWGLTPAECDVAKLSFRGLKIADIAEARQKSQGTVKAQIGSILRKSGVTTRSEFMGLLTEELIDFAFEREEAQAN